MKAYHQRKGDMLTRVCKYVVDNAVTPPIPRATALFAEANTLKTALQTYSGTQLLGHGGYRGGATERAGLAKEIRTVLLDMAATARGLEGEHPGMTDQFRLGRSSSSLAQLLATAHAFKTAATPAAVKQLFTDRAFAEDFDVQLTTKIAALETALSRKAGGLQTQRLGAASLDALSRRITAVMRELRPLMVKHLRDNEPTLLEVWNAAARSYADPMQEPAPAETESSGSGI
jgi:hypothetical protein